MTENLIAETTVSRPAASGASLLQACRNQLFPRPKNAPLDKHLHAAYTWLCRGSLHGLPELIDAMEGIHLVHAEGDAKLGLDTHNHIDVRD